jgi:putative phosphoesterase
MKLILISDSHGNKEGIDKIFSQLDFDYLFFMGDGLSDLGTYINLEYVYAVSGNCDFFSRVDNEKCLELGEYKIFMTHGNKYGVKSSLNHLIERGDEVGANLVFYGHTHRQNIEYINNVYYINPGKFYPNSDGESVGIEVVLDENGVRAGTFRI